jgi:hypothetical protein
MRGGIVRKLLAAAALGSASVAFAQSPAPAPALPAVDYSSGSNWLCRPGRTDPCGRPLPTAALNANGYGSVGQVAPAANPAIDCFYVYPTVSRDPADNSDLVPGVGEQVAAAAQFARFATLCRPFAPMYRQTTLTALARALASGDRRPPASFEIAYGDVRAAWRRYLQNDNRGRPFVLIGHSQGAFHLQRLLASEIEGRPEARRMLSALIIGANVEVPEGRVVGGTFQRTPLCTRVGQTGCVVTFVSFRAATPPPEAALFGRSAAPGRTVACTNPASLGSGRSVPLDSYWYAGPSVTNTRTAIAWSSQGASPTTFLRTEGLVSAACVNSGPLGYLAVTVNADPADARTDRIPGDVEIFGRVQPGWGLHLVDLNLAMGDLLRLVEAQRDAFLRPRRR